MGGANPLVNPMMGGNAFPSYPTGQPGGSVFMPPGENYVQQAPYMIQADARMNAPSMMGLPQGGMRASAVSTFPGGAMMGVGYVRDPGYSVQGPYRG